VTGLERADLIALCERGVVPQSGWFNRDSAGAQIQLATARTLLLSGCEFVVADDPESDDKTLWIEITYEGFNYHEVGDRTTDTFYLPTAARLDEVAGKDWY
jgi:hypothetical protein